MLGALDEHRQPVVQHDALVMAKNINQEHCPGAFSPPRMWPRFAHPNPYPKTVTRNDRNPHPDLINSAACHYPGMQQNGLAERCAIASVWMPLAQNTPNGLSRASAGST